MTDESLPSIGIQSSSDLEIISKLIKEYQEAAHDTNNKVIEMLEKINNDFEIVSVLDNKTIKLIEELNEKWPQDFGAIFVRIDENINILNEMRNKIVDIHNDFILGSAKHLKEIKDTLQNDNTVYPSFYLKVGIAIGVPTIINIASIIMNLSGVKLFYW